MKMGTKAKQIKTWRSEMKKSIFMLLVTICFALTFCMVHVGNVSAEPITLKAVTGWPKTSTENKSFFFFTELVEQMVAKQFPGELKIQYIGGPEAVKNTDQVQKLRSTMRRLQSQLTRYQR